jgi:hypothetical protein
MFEVVFYSTFFFPQDQTCEIPKMAQSNRRRAGRKPGKKHRKKVDYEQIGKYLWAACTDENERNLKDSGPYSVAATRLGWTNSLNMRQYLRTIWKSNRSAKIKWSCRDH